MIQQISHYRVEGELGRGGMGIVYRALDSKLGRAVAIKLLPPEATADPERHQRFIQEARAASALNHPNIVITRDGRVKVLDFGLAKLVEGPSTDATLTALATRPGTVMGTLAYMSPEQAQGERVGAQSDVFALGAVLRDARGEARVCGYVGRGDHDRDPARSSTTASLRPARHPPGRGCDRHASAHKRHRVAICGCGPDAEGTRRLTCAAHPCRGSARRGPAVLVPVAVLLIAAAALGTWQTVSNRRSRWAQREAVPEIERLHFTERSLDAVRLARRAEAYAADDITRIRAAWFPFETATDPPGAELSIRNYLDEHGDWESLGTTPVRDLRLPQGLYRLRITRSGYLPMDVTYSVGRPSIRLVPEADAIPGMIFVPGGPVTAGMAGTVELPEYWIDKFEVTNAEFKKFVDAGGYGRAEYWTEPLRLRRESRQQFLLPAGCATTPSR